MQLLLSAPKGGHDSCQGDSGGPLQVSTKSRFQSFMCLDFLYPYFVYLLKSTRLIDKFSIQIGEREGRSLLFSRYLFGSRDANFASSLNEKSCSNIFSNFIVYHN